MDWQSNPNPITINLILENISYQKVKLGGFALLLKIDMHNEKLISS